MATSTMKNANSTYTFQSQPRAVAPQRRKYRNEQPGMTVTAETGMYGNIMHDPRVVRGNTYRQQTLPAAAQPDPIEIQRKQELARRRLARKRAEQKMRPKSPEPVAGRAHIEVQTELYLEELSDRVEEKDQPVQTDPFLDRPPSPLYIPAKTGVDAETQIEDGELFDFDIESKPILEVLVGKTIEQALMEVMEEEELDNLRDHQREFEELRTAELVETQRLEEQARRRREEKERRLAQQQAVAQAEMETAAKIAARALAQSYLSGLVPSVYNVLDDGGYFFDQQEREIESVMIPWLMDGVEEELQKEVRARALLDMIILEVVTARAAEHAPPPEPVEPADEQPAEGAEAGAAEDQPTDGADETAPAPAAEGGDDGEKPAEGAEEPPVAAGDAPDGGEPPADGADGAAPADGAEAEAESASAAEASPEADEKPDEKPNEDAAPAAE